MKNHATFGDFFFKSAFLNSRYFRRRSKMASPRWLLLMLLPVLLEGKEELHIGGLFPLAPGWWYNLGNRCLQAALLAVKHINNDTSVLGDYELVLDYNDTRVSLNMIFIMLKAK